jgi:DedD protein
VDRHLKERLIGAAVLLALAWIFIPEMLSSPASRSASETATAVTADGSAIKTYTIDLRQREQADPHAAAMPPPELPMPEAPAAEPSKPQVVEPPAAPVAASEPKPAPEPVVDVPKPEAKPESKPESKPEPKPASKPAGGDYVVQVTSLDSRAAAEKIAGDLKRAGFASFVMAVEVKGKMMYRVRVGPAGTRAEADALLAKVKRTQPGAAVMRHP